MEIVAVSVLKIFWLIFNGLTSLKLKISSLSFSEKSPSGPTIAHNGLLAFLLISNFFFDEFKSAKISSIFFELRLIKFFNFCEH